MQISLHTMSGTESKQKGKARKAPQTEEPGTVSKSLLEMAMEMSEPEESSRQIIWAKLYRQLDDAKNRYLASENTAGTFYQLYKELKAATSSLGKDLYLPDKSRHELIGRYLEQADGSKKSAGRPKDDDKLHRYLYAWFTLNLDRESEGKEWTSSHRIPAADIAKRAHAMGLTATKHNHKNVRSLLVANGYDKKKIKYP